MPGPLAMVRVRNAVLAKDLVHDNLLAALRGREKFAGRSSERGWVSGILKHKIIDHYRKLGRETSFRIALTDTDWPDGRTGRKISM